MSEEATRVTVSVKKWLRFLNVFDSTTAFSEIQLVCSGTTVLHLSIAAWATKLLERESFGKRGVKPDIFWPSLTSNCCCHLHDSHWVKLPLSHPYIVSGWVHIQSCFVMFLQDMLRKNRPSQLSEIIAAGFVTNTVCDGRWTVICSSLRSLEFWFRLCCWPCEFGANHPNS